MPKSLENPFHSLRDAPTDLVAFAEQGFLPPDEVAKLKELEARKDRSSKFDVPSSMSDISLEEGMTDDEILEKEKFESDPANTRKRLVNWAREFGIFDNSKSPAASAEEWTDIYFDFDEDGTATCRYDLNLNQNGITYFPAGITVMHGSLLLSDNKLANLENLPKVIHGHLYVGRNPAKVFPIDIKIGQRLCLSADQKELIKDAKAKGYKVRIY